MLSTLFKGRNPLAAARAEKRLSAIRALTAEKAEKLRAEINTCARDDADVRVRRAILAWVDDQALLADLLADDAIAEPVAARLADLGADLDHPAVRLARIRRSNSSADALKAADGVTAPEQLATLYIACPEACREALLPGLRALGERGLTVLERESRNHDKQVNRTARTELDALRNAKRSVDELAQRAHELLAALDRATGDSAPARTRQLRRALEDCVRGVRDQAKSLTRYGLQPPNVEGWLAPMQESVPSEPGQPQAEPINDGLDPINDGLEPINAGLGPIDSSASEESRAPAAEGSTAIGESATVAGVSRGEPGESWADAEMSPTEAAAPSMDSGAIHADTGESLAIAHEPPAQADQSPPNSSPTAAGLTDTQAGVGATSVENSPSDFAALVTELQSLDECMVAGAPAAELRPSHDKLINRWLALAGQGQPDKAHKAVFDSVSRHFHELTQATERLQPIDLRSADAPQIPADWPDSPDELQALWKQQRGLERTASKLQRQQDAVAWPQWAAQPVALATVAAHITALETFVQRLAEHQQALDAELAKSIEMAGADIEEGHLKAAQSNLGNARKLTRLLPEAIARRHRKALIAVATRVDELQDWQAFATSPKRQELLDDMQTLAATTPTNAKDHADSIKALRNAWNALGPASEPSGRAMYAQFNRYAERAFEPCRAYFNEQAELRKHNLAQRRLICEQLEEYVENVDWANADMRAAEQILRTARNEWRAHHPVDRRHAKPLETRFEKLQQRIFGHVKSVWDANLDAKRAIVAAAEELASADVDIGEKIRGAKALQRQWQAVGMTPRNPDQKLWRQFREQCDQIFEARESEHKQVRNERESSIAEAEAVCENMRAAVAEAERDPAKADRSTLARLRGELYAIKLPERVEKGLHKRFDDIARSYNQLLLAGQIEALCEELQQLKMWDIEVSGAEAEGSPIPAPTRCFENRPAQGDEPAQALHRLTLEAELQAGVESPPEDRQLRLEVQVAALNQSMGQRAAEKEPRELAEAWCQLGPKSDASNALRERFFNAVLKLARPYR